jgi:beta-glucosidase
LSPPAGDRLAENRDPNTPGPPFLFPDDFLWGAAVSAYQVEGSPLADGAGPSNWHRFTHTPGFVDGGDTGDVACDFYRRYSEDVARMRELGLNAFRFSVSWSRILPEGRGAINRKGLDFYERLVDSLLAEKIRPVVTVYHWDLPAALEDRGGWLNPDIAAWFADYARILYRALDDRVPMWATLNEPWVVTDGGYLHGKLAPGHRSVFEAPLAAHHLLRAHAEGVRAYRAEGRHAVGMVVNIEPKYPASSAPADLAATRRATAYMNRQFLDPVFLGRYPRELDEIFGEAWPAFPAAEVEAIRQPIDFLGVNYYTRGVTRHSPKSFPVRARSVRQIGRRYTATRWEVYPKGLTDTLLWIRQRYGAIPLYITENGAAFSDPPGPRGPVVEDPLRVDYLRTHLIAAGKALEAGADLRGYFVWSLLDNLEWSHGFSKRFGIVHVDHRTQKRTPKASARFYADVIRTRGAILSGRSKGRPASRR